MARIAILLDQDFEDSEFQVPFERLSKAGHEITVIGKRAGEEVRGKKGKHSHEIDQALGDVRAESFDALVVPGGYSPDKLRMIPEAVRFTKRMSDDAKPIAAICHAPSLLIEAGLVRGRRLTSWPSIKTDLVNAGAVWEDREVIEDGNLITSRNPEDLDAFCNAILRRLPAGGARGTAERS